MADYASPIVDETIRNDQKDSFYEAESNFVCNEDDKIVALEEHEVDEDIHKDKEQASCKKKDYVLSEGTESSKNIKETLESAMNRSSNNNVSTKSSSFEEVDISLLNPSEVKTHSQHTKRFRKKCNKAKTNDLKCSEIAILASALKRKQRELDDLASRCYKALSRAQDELNDAEAENEELVTENDMLRELLEYILSESTEES